VRRLAALALAALAACGRAGNVEAPRPRHLVLVTIDTLRADRLGAYGARDVKTPVLDRIAREGALGREMTAHVPLTRPSHASILSGRLPTEHGLRDNVSPSLPAATPLLAEMLRAAGFRTAGIVSSVVLQRQSGLDRGFELYSDAFEGDGDDARFLNSLQKRGDVVLPEATSWLEKAKKDERLFLWLHLYDPHDPYEPPEPYATEYAGRPYDGEVAWTDELVGRLDAALGRLGLRGDTLLVVTSDHGEGLGEHGENGHGYFVYQSTLHVPLLLRGPGIPPGTTLKGVTRGVDVVPTVLDLLGVAPPAGAAFAGRSLAPSLRAGGALREAPAYAESLMPLLHYGWSDLRTLREGRFKYIQAPRPELYDLETDPHEAQNLFEAQGSRAEAMRAALGKYLEAERQHAASLPEMGAASVPPELLEKLGALGYIGAGAPGQGSSPGADPKDKLEDFKAANRLIREGLTQLREKDYPASVARFRELLKRGIESFEVHYYLGRGLLEQRRFAEAAPHFEGAIRYQPGYAMAYESLAECRLAKGDAPGALEALARGRKALPKDAGLPQREAQVRKQSGDRAGALAAYESALALDKKSPLLRMRAGELYRDAGDLSRAAALMREATTLDPASASYWNSLGMVLGARSEFGEAEKAFREAVARDAKDSRYAYNLGLALVRQDRREEARPFFRKSLELDPRFSPAREQLSER
jgi:arylsulfatase A-like enzyme/tetratricopeptide (TPR) repeat protein